VSPNFRRRLAILVSPTITTDIHEVMKTPEKRLVGASNVTLEVENQKRTLTSSEVLQSKSKQTLSPATSTREH